MVFFSNVILVFYCLYDGSLILLAIVSICKMGWLRFKLEEVGGGGRIALWLCLVIRGTNLKFSDWQF